VDSIALHFHSKLTVAEGTGAWATVISRNRKNSHGFILTSIHTEPKPKPGPQETDVDYG
jgi:hypothetical protein